MKIIKHTFEIPQLEVIDGELVEKDPNYTTCTFTLLHGGIGRFEEVYGKSLLTKLNDINKLPDEEKIGSLLDDKDFIKDLAAASYVKLEGNKFENNRATMDEFLNSELANYLYDVDFLTKLLQMSAECMIGEKKGKSNGKNK